jgi:hypothetical protein
LYPQPDSSAVAAGMTAATKNFLNATMIITSAVIESKSHASGDRRGTSALSLRLEAVVVESDGESSRKA